MTILLDALDKLSKQVADPAHVYAISADQAAAVLGALGVCLPAPAPKPPETQTVSYTVQFERKLPRSQKLQASFGQQVCESIRKDHGCYIAEVIDTTVIT